MKTNLVWLFSDDDVPIECKNKVANGGDCHITQVFFVYCRGLPVVIGFGEDLSGNQLRILRKSICMQESLLCHPNN